MSTPSVSSSSFEAAISLLEQIKATSHSHNSRNSITSTRSYSEIFGQLEFFKQLARSEQFLPNFEQYIKQFSRAVSLRQVPRGRLLFHESDNLSTISFVLQGTFTEFRRKTTQTIQQQLFWNSPPPQSKQTLSTAPPASPSKAITPPPPTQSPKKRSTPYIFTQSPAKKSTRTRQTKDFILLPSDIPPPNPFNKIADFYQTDSELLRQSLRGCVNDNRDLKEIYFQQSLCLFQKSKDFIPGNHFGVMSVSQSRGTVVCSESGFIAEINCEELNKIFEPLSTQLNFIENLFANAFPNLKSIVCTQIAFLFKPIHLAMHERIFDIDDDITTLYVLQRGEVEYRDHSSRRLYRLSTTATIFGHEEVLLSQSRTFQAVSSTSSTLVYMIPISQLTSITQFRPYFKQITEASAVSLQQKFQQESEDILPLEFKQNSSSATASASGSGQRLSMKPSFSPDLKSKQSKGRLYSPRSESPAISRLSSLVKLHTQQSSQSTILMSSMLSAIPAKSQQQSDMQSLTRLNSIPSLQMIPSMTQMQLTKTSATATNHTTYLQSPSKNSLIPPPPGLTLSRRPSSNRDILKKQTFDRLQSSQAEPSPDNLPSRQYLFPQPSPSKLSSITSRQLTSNVGSVSSSLTQFDSPSRGGASNMQTVTALPLNNYIAARAQPESIISFIFDQYNLDDHGEGRAITANAVTSGSQAQFKQEKTAAAAHFHIDSAEKVQRDMEKHRLTNRRYLVRQMPPSTAAAGRSSGGIYSSPILKGVDMSDVCGQKISSNIRGEPLPPSPFLSEKPKNAFFDGRTAAATAASSHRKGVSLGNLTERGRISESEHFNASIQATRHLNDRQQHNESNGKTNTDSLTLKLNINSSRESSADLIQQQTHLQRKVTSKEQLQQNTRSEAELLFPSPLPRLDKKFLKTERSSRVASARADESSSPQKQQPQYQILNFLGNILHRNTAEGRPATNH